MRKKYQWHCYGKSPITSSSPPSSTSLSGRRSDSLFGPFGQFPSFPESQFQSTLESEGYRFHSLFEAFGLFSSFHESQLQNTFELISNRMVIGSTSSLKQSDLLLSFPEKMMIKMIIMMTKMMSKRTMMLMLERFSNDCRKTKTKAITPTNHNRSKQRHEPITIPSNYL